MDGEEKTTLFAGATEPWSAYETTPGKGTSGWGFIRQNFNPGKVFGMDSFMGPNGNAQELRDILNQYEAENADLRRQLEEAHQDFATAQASWGEQVDSLQSALKAREQALRDLERILQRRKAAYAQYAYGIVAAAIAKPEALSEGRPLAYKLGHR